LAKINSRWPDYFPLCCPPTKAVQRATTVYRLVESTTIKRKDFVSKGTRRRRYAECSCEEYALSVLENSSDLHVALLYFSSIELDKFNKAAVGHITVESGLVLSEPSKNVGQSHLNWWTYEGVEPHTFFSEVLLIGVDI